MNHGFSQQSLDNTQISHVMKILPVGTELFQPDRPTEGHDEANSRFSQYCEST
jgi:hypothetical protein